MYMSRAYCLSSYLESAAPINLSYSGETTFTKDTSVAELIPSFSGDSASFSVSPSLPDGLSIDENTGIISGTATSVTPSAGYFVTAENGGGSDTVLLTLEVIDIAPSNLDYGVINPSFTVGTEIGAISPSNSGGEIINYSVSPNLPNGIDLDSASGLLTGTPTEISASTMYTITGTNSGGSTSVQLTITVLVAAPLSISYASQSYSFTNTVQIPPQTPSYSGGQPSSYSVSPSLPSGLTLNANTGLISGKPLGIFASAVYTVTGSNVSGSVTRALTIIVNDVAPSNLSYTRMFPTYKLNTAIEANLPYNDGGAVVSYSVSPALPQGLSLNTTTGVISGTPTAVVSAQLYAITATNSGGTTSASLTIGVTSLDPIFNTPAAYTSGEKLQLTINRSSLAATAIVQAHPIFAEQSNWFKVQVIYENDAIPYGNTHRITGLTFRGVGDMIAVFRAQAQSGDVYEIRKIYLVRENGQRLDIARDDLLTPTALDIAVD